MVFALQHSQVWLFVVCFLSGCYGAMLRYCLWDTFHIEELQCLNENKSIPMGMCISCVYTCWFFVNILFLYLFFIQLYAYLSNSFSCTFCILSCCNTCISPLCLSVSVWFSSADCPHMNKKTFWQPVTIWYYTLTLFSCPAGRCMTVPVTLMTDSTVRLRSSAFKWLADFKQKEIC